MLSRFKVRTKLLAIVLPLVLGLGVVSVIGVSDRIAQRDQAERTAAVLQAVGAGAAVVDALQLERLAAVSPAGMATGSWVERTRATDAAASTLWDRLGPVADSGMTVGDRSIQQVVRAFRRQLDSVADARPSAPVAPADARGVLTQYSTIVEGLLDLDASLVGTTGDIGASSRSAVWIAASNEGDARAAAGVMILVQAGAQSADPSLAWVVPEVLEQHGSAMTYIDVFKKQASTSDRSGYDAAIREPAFLASINPFLALGSLQQGGTVQVQAAQWSQLAVDHQSGLRSFERKLVQEDVTAATARAAALDREVRLFLGGALAAVLLGLLVAASVARSMVAAVSRLTKAATSIADDQLPTLVEALRSSKGPVGVQVDSIDVSGRDEFAKLADAFNAVQRTASAVATEQAATLRKGISDLFVNLARRNQTLLDRQIEFIDRLEANEEDPDQLENLFKLDHLATRMRRNAESLLVLAGSEAPRRRSKEVSITDVIRVAVGEVEDFARISLLAVDEAMALGSAAVDVAHLLSELMENGTQYSPPDRRVEVVGHRTNSGGYVISVSDQGVGMTPEQMHLANETLTHPPAVGLTLSRSLGFIVVATLAARHGIDVRLAPSPAGGVTAMVTMPPSLVVALETVEVAIEEPAAPVEEASTFDTSFPMTFETSFDPSYEPSYEPTYEPSYEASSEPSYDDAAFEPGEQPTHQLTSDASPADEPSYRPVHEPVDEPVHEPSYEPSYDAFPEPEQPYLPAAPFASGPPVAPAEPVAPVAYYEPFPPAGADLAASAFAPESIPDQPVPVELDDRVPMGEAFERGLFSLLDGHRPGDPGHRATPVPEGFPAAPVPPSSAPPAPESPPYGAHPGETGYEVPPRAPESNPLRRVPVWSARPGPSPDAAPPAPAPVLPTPAPVFPLAGPAPLPRRIVDHPAHEHPAHEHPAHVDPWAPAPTIGEFHSAPAPASERLSALPKRVPGGVNAHLDSATVDTGAAKVAAPLRAPDEVRSILARYRSGLEGGRRLVAESHPVADEGAGESPGAVEHHNDPRQEW